MALLSILSKPDFYHQLLIIALILFRMVLSGRFRDSGRGRGAERSTSLKLSHIFYNDQTYNSYMLPEEDLKNINHVTHPLSSAEFSIFFKRKTNFYIKKYRYRLHFNAQFLISLSVPESLKVALIYMVAVLIILAKLATLGLLKIKVF